jgi:hypothetical protein
MPINPGKRPRGNPNWGKSGPSAPPQPSSFEKLLAKLGLNLSALRGARRARRGDEICTQVCSKPICA